MSLTRLGYVSINVIELEGAITHYTQVVGLRLIERTPDGRAYLQALDSQDHHCVVLTEKGRAGLDHAGFKVNDPGDLAAIQQELRQRGITSRPVIANDISGQGAGVRFTAPSGHDLVLYYHADKVGYGAGMINPDPVAPTPGTGTCHLDHMVITCENPAEMSTFLIDTFGFYITEQVNTPDGMMLAVFLSCTNKMHDVAITPGPNGGFHHMAFALENRSDVIVRTDILKQRAVPTLELGITRHGVAGVTTVYFLDPAGNRNEFFHGAYLAPGVGGKVPTVIWDISTSERALFYYEGVVPSSFLSDVT